MSESANLVLHRLREHLKPHGAVADFSRQTRIPRKNLDNWLAGRNAIPGEAYDLIAKGMGYSATWELVKPNGDQAALRMSRSDLLGKIVLRLGGYDETNLLGVLKYLETIVINSEKNEELVRGGR